MQQGGGELVRIGALLVLNYAVLMEVRRGRIKLSSSVFALVIVVEQTNFVQMTLVAKSSLKVLSDVHFFNCLSSQ